MFNYLKIKVILKEINCNKFGRRYVSIMCVISPLLRQSVAGLTKGEHRLGVTELKRLLYNMVFYQKST